MRSTSIWTRGADYISHFIFSYMSGGFISDVRRFDYNQSRSFCLIRTRALISLMLNPSMFLFYSVRSTAYNNPIDFD